MEAVIAHLVRYVAVLAQSARETTRAEDRHVYTAHLATAAELFLAAYEADAAKLRDLTSRERRAYGWGYLSGAQGHAAEKAFVEFAHFIEGADADAA